MATAELVADDLSGFAGPATLYRIDPPLRGTEYLLLFYRPEIFGQPGQLNVILSDRYGAVFGGDIRPQPGTYITAEPNHALALQLAGGYTIVDAVPELDESEVSVQEVGLPDDEKTFDPAEHTVVQVNEYLAGAEPVERERVLALEADGKARKTILGRWQS